MISPQMHLWHKKTGALRRFSTYLRTARLPSEGRWPGKAGSEGGEVKVWNMLDRKDLSLQTTVHPSVAYGDSSPQGEP